MFTLPIFFAALAVVIYVTYQVLFTRRSKDYPPGPFPFPFFGSVFGIGRKPHLTFCKWSKQYGPIFSVKLGTTRTVVLNDAKLIKEAFNEQAFSGRPDNKAISIFSGGKYGVICSDSTSWVEQRRFTLRNLRDLGFGKKSMESLILEDVQGVLDWLRSQGGKPVYLQHRFALATFNCLWMLIAGTRFHHDDPQLTEMLERNAVTSRELAETGLCLFFPEFSEKFPEWSGWNTLVRTVQPTIDLFHKTVNEHEETLPEAYSRDFIDAYLHEIKRTTDPKSSFHKDNEVDKSIRAVVADLFLAGSDTTSTTLTWAVLYLVSFPETQRKLQDEIESVIGKSRLPTLSDKPNMPYTEALTMEAMRMSSIAPLGVFHNTMTQTELGGYKLPKDTMIIANMHSAHHDPNVWDDPESFQPERFLSADGRTVLKHEALIPFSFGKRACPGEGLARDSLFLFLTSIFQRFELVQNTNEPPPSLEADPGFVMSAKKFTVIANDRLGECLHK